MSTPIPFTDNYRDLSNTDGYQFEFRCERCGNGYRSAFKRSMRNTGTSVLRGMSSMFGQQGRKMAQSAERMLDRGTNSPEKDKALRAAVAEIAPQFKQCRGCGDWMCEAACWNPEVGQCVRCSPIISEQMAQLQARERRNQMQKRLEDTVLTDGMNFGQQSIPRCPNCDAQTAGGKFCGECGTPLAVVKQCGRCRAENPGAARFCAHCGDSFA